MYGQTFRVFGISRSRDHSDGSPRSTGKLMLEHRFVPSKDCSSHLQRCQCDDRLGIPSQIHYPVLCGSIQHKWADYVGFCREDSRQRSIAAIIRALCDCWTLVILRKVTFTCFIDTSASNNVGRKSDASVDIHPTYLCSGILTSISRTDQNHVVNSDHAQLQNHIDNQLYILSPQKQIFVISNLHWYCNIP